MTVCIQIIIVEADALASQMHASTAGSHLVMMYISPGASGSDGITVDVLLMMSNVVVIHLHVRASAG